MDPNVAIVLAAVVGAIGVIGSAYFGKERSKRIANAVNPPDDDDSPKVSLVKKSGEEQFIDFLRSESTEMKSRLSALEADRATDKATIVALEAKVVKQSARIDELEKTDREKDAHIIVLQHWGMYSPEPPPRKLPPWKVPSNDS